MEVSPASVSETATNMQAKNSSDTEVVRKVPAWSVPLIGA